MRRPRDGYTVIEVMIVLAVSSVMFFAAVTMLSGKQGRTEFSQATRDIESQIQSVVNDVGVSRFPEASQYTCKLDGTEHPVLQESPAGTGTNTECIFLGKVLQIVNDDDPSTTDSFNIYTVLGRRAQSDGTAVTSFADANPTPIMRSVPADPDLTESYTLPFGTNVESAIVGSPPDTDLVGFYNGLQQTDVEPGSQSLLTLGYIGFNTTYDDPYQTVKSTIEAGSPQSITAWAICISSGTSSETAKITVNAAFSGITTKMDYGACGEAT